MQYDPGSSGTDVTLQRRDIKGVGLKTNTLSQGNSSWKILDINSVVGVARKVMCR